MKNPRRLLHHTLSLLLVLLLQAPTAQAQSSIELRTGNDILAGNSRSDDLYTAGLALTYEFQNTNLNGRRLGRGFATFEENLFTDREAGQRFDETWFLLGRRLRRGNTNYSVYAGAVRAGRGVFGERAQNAVHSVIGDEDVNLEYVEGNQHFAVLGAALRTDLAFGRGWSLQTRVEGRVAQGFKQWLSLGVDGSWPLNRWLEVFASIGARATWAEYDLLEPWTEPLDLTAEVGVALKERLVVSWTQNEYGTGMGHLSLAYRVPVKLRTGDR
ncbi:MAG: hypothetical protein AAF690_26860 [Acidobacteriota bacterium]